MKRAKILVVDDSPEVIDLFSSILSAEGYQVLQASTGNECLRITRKEHPEMILLDVVLPDISGIEVCAQIKADPELARILVVHVSGRLISTDSQAEGLEAGADGYLTKPVDPRTLLAHVAAMLRIKDTEAALQEAHDELESRVEQRTAELEIANTLLREEIADRKQAQEELAVSEERYRELFENAQDAIYVHDLDGKYISVNRAALKISGYQRAEVIGKHFAHFVAPDHLKRVRAHLRRKLANHTQSVYECEVVAKDGRHVPVEVNSNLIYRDGVAWGVQGTARDLSERKSTLEALRNAKETLQTIFDAAPVAICGIDAEGRITNWNDGAQRMFGWVAEETIGCVCPTVPEDGLTDFHEMIHRVMRYGPQTGMAYYRQKKSGERILASISAGPLRDAAGKAVGVMLILEDITERKRVEEERRHLLRRLVTAQEEEQRRLSRELHDQTGQSLAALVLGLKSIEDSGQLKKTEQQRLHQLRDLTNQLARDVHHLASKLRPTALDDLGLNTALSNYVEEWAERAGIRADFHSNGLMTERLPQQIETAVYRIIQEALTNVLKHAGAENVSVIVEHRRNRVQAIIEDDGRGFDEALLSAPIGARRLGLLGMQERVALVNGRLNIESTPGSGTTVIVHIPVSTAQLEADN